MSETVTAGKRLEKFPAFDGFRGIGVLIVVFSHYPEVIESSFYNLLWKANQASRIGYVALDIFFAISGFFITRLLLRERAKTGSISFRNFFMRRALRIFPVYYVTVLACYFIFRIDPAEMVSLLTYTFNFFIPFNPAPNPLEHTWSLSVEEQFYFFWPLLILLVPPRWLLVVTGRVIPVLAIASGLVMAWIIGTQDNLLSGNFVYMSISTRMLSLSLGGWLAIREFENRPLRGWPCLAMVIAALVLLLGDRFARDSGIVASQGVYWTIALSAYSMISVAFVSTLVFDQGAVRRYVSAFLSMSLFRGLGHISYAMYVFHLPVLFYFGLNDGALHGAKAPIMQVELAFAITMVLSVMSYYLIENPLSSLKQSFSTVSAQASTTSDVSITDVSSSAAGTAAGRREAT